MRKCYKCGRFMKRLPPDTMGEAVLTGFPPDKPAMASSIPYAAFACSNHQPCGIVTYFQVNFEITVV